MHNLARSKFERSGCPVFGFTFCLSRFCTVQNSSRTCFNVRYKTLFDKMCPRGMQWASENCEICIWSIRSLKNLPRKIGDWKENYKNHKIEPHSLDSLLKHDSLLILKTKKMFTILVLFPERSALDPANFRPLIRYNLIQILHQ